MKERRQKHEIIDGRQIWKTEVGKRRLEMDKGHRDERGRWWRPSL